MERRLFDIRTWENIKCFIRCLESFALCSRITMEDNFSLVPVHVDGFVTIDLTAYFTDL